MRALLFAVCLVASLAVGAHAASIAYEGVQYPGGPLTGRGPAFGFALPWLADPGVAVALGTLASPLALPSTGNSVAGGFNFVDRLSDSLVVAPGKEFWASFLLYHGAPNDQTFMGLAPAGVPLGAPPAAAFGVRLFQYGIFVGGTFTAALTPYTPPGSTDFLVAHFVAGGASWIVSLFVNPTSFAVPVLVLNVPPVSYGAMVNQNQSGFGSDEFRLGDTAGDVAAGATSVAVGADGAEPTALCAIVPNPLRSETTIRYEAPRGARVQLAVVDVRGRLIAALADDDAVEGMRSVRWDGTDGEGRRVSPGVYFVRLTSGGVVKTGTVLVVP